MESFTITNLTEERYSRHHLIDWWDQTKLKNARVLVAGVGALGNEVLKNLALLGIGHVTLIDFDTVSVTNLTRSVLFRESDIGLAKVEAARQRGIEINPELSIHTIQGDLQFDLGIGNVRSHDVIIGCLDSVNARWAINQLAYRAGIPWINGGIGVTEGEVSFFDPRSESACFECSLSSQTWERRNQRYSCHGMKRDVPEKMMPTTAPIASIIAAMQVHQALVYLHNKTSFLNSGEKVFLSLNPWASFKAKIQHQESCTTHNFSVDSIIRLPFKSELSAQAICQNLQQLGFQNPVISLRNEVVTVMQCLDSNCNHFEQINYPLRQLAESALVCPKCGKERDFEVIRSFSISQHPDINLVNLCLPGNEILFGESDGRSFAIEFY
ncbi:ThiF family adenylyltransferase [Cyanobacteria bacterium FACHB-471]|nr:ThiF family adenylyltransferase [Cyanobacteria bacterium FACHB-471]